MSDTKNNNGFLFPQEKNILTNMEFIDIISQESYYVVFANIKLYKKIDDGIIINTYKDFLKSSCLLILLITDNEFVEIYSKNKDILEKIYDNAVENKFIDINYITENNFKRKSFSAYDD